MTLVSLFLSQFSLVFLLVWQSRCVRDSQYLLAMLNSLCLGLAGLVITPTIAATDLSAKPWSEIATYLSAGPLAVVLAIYLHNRHSRHPWQPQSPQPPQPQEQE